MKDDAKNHISVGDLARKGGVTVRTLQFYDKSGLLSPSEYTEGGRRMYGVRDVLRLQQILFLKNLGFSLDEIRDRLLPAESASQLRQIFVGQRQALWEQISRMESTLSLMDGALAEIEAGGDIAPDTLFALVGATRIDNPYSFMIRHFSKDQLENMVSRFDSEDAALRFNIGAKELFSEMLELHKKRADPAGAEGQQVAKRWWDLVMDITGGNPQLIGEMIAVGANEDNWPAEAAQLKTATMEFLGTALGIYLQSIGIDIPLTGGERHE